MKRNSSPALRRVGAAGRPLLWPLLALGLLLVFDALCTPGFFVMHVRDGRLFGTLVDVLNHGSRVAIVAIGMTLVIATGGVDLSVGAVAAIAGAILAQLVANDSTPWPVAVLIALGAAGVCGLWNGLLVTKVRVQPIVATLILMVAGRGVAQLITGGLTVTFHSPSVAAIGNGSWLGLPLPVTLLAGALLVVGIGTRWTALGLFVESVGDNETASRLAGVPDRAARLAVYAVCGMLAGLSGIIECSYIKAADSNNAGNLLELDAILAVVIGGTALRGGRYSLLGTVIGAMFLQTLTKTLYMQNVSAEIAPAPKAAVVIVVCLLQAPVVRSWAAGRIAKGRRA